MTVGDWLSQAEQKLNRAGIIATARLDARVLLEALSARERTWLLAHPEHVLNTQLLKRLNIALDRRVAREPLAYILNQREFYGLDFVVSPDVLIPRPETEVLVETAISMAFKKGNVLEIGTGSGAIAVALKTHRPDVRLIATDISDPALSVANQNAKRHGATIEFLQSDLFNSVKGRHDLILANLPYVPDATRKQPELDYEPRIALYSGADGLDHYRRFFEQIPHFLNKSGQVIIEAGPTQRAELKKLAAEQNLNLRSISEYIAILK